MIDFNMLFVYGVATFNLTFSLIYLTIYFLSKRIGLKEDKFLYGGGLFFSTFIYFISQTLLEYYRSINLITEMIFWQRIQHVGVYFTMFFVLFYVLKATKVYFSVKTLVTAFMAVATVICLMLFTNLIILDHVRNFNGCTIMGDEGPLYFITYVMLVVFVGLSYFFIFKTFKKYKGEERRGLCLIFWGLIIGSIGSIYDVLGTLVDIRFLAEVSVFSYGVFLMELFFIYEIGSRILTTIRELYKANLKIKKQDDALVRGAKFEMMGQLVSGVLHDLRHVISFVSLSNDNLEILTEDASKAQVVVFKQRDSIEMSVVLLDNLSSFANGKLDIGDKFSKFSPYVVIKKIEKIFAGKMKSAYISFKSERSPDIVLSGRDSFFMQVLFNLLLNSIDELIKEGGKIVFEQVKLEDNRYAIFNFSDDGLGIDTFVKEHMFDFLYTTKEAGSGLGLYITQKIIVASGGSIKLLDTPSTTTFQISWPLVY